MESSEARVRSLEAAVMRSDAQCSAARSALPFLSDETWRRRSYRSLRPRRAESGENPSFWFLAAGDGIRSTSSSSAAVLAFRNPAPRGHEFTSGLACLRPIEQEESLQASQVRTVLIN